MTRAPAITYHAAASRQAEAKAVAAEIAARARQGTPYSRMAVICRNADQYLAPLRYEFRLQNIPLFCDEATSPENTDPRPAPCTPRWICCAVCQAAACCVC